MLNADNIIIADFKWVFTGDEESCEDDQKYKSFLKEMFKSSTSTFLLLKREEEEYLKNYK